MLTKCTCFLLLFVFIFLCISYLCDLLLTLWITNPTDTLLSTPDIGLHQLKLILGLRGIYYAKRFSDDDLLQEKLAHLVTTSGSITRNELIQLNIDEASDSTEKQYKQVKVFASAKLMEEELDDNDVWLLYVNTSEDTEAESQVWSEVVRRFGKFDLRFARFDCKADRMYCNKKHWQSPRIVLVYPKLRYESEKRIYHYPLETSTHSTDVILWLQSQLSSQLSYITDVDHWLERSDHQQRSNPNLVKMVAILGEQFRPSPPLSLSLLALHFRERIHFAVHFASPPELSHLHAKLQTNIDPRLPIYLISRSHQPAEDDLVVFNANNYEALSYPHLDVYLRGLILDANDIYLALFSLVNIYLGLNLFWTRCMTARKHLRLCFIKALEFNFILTSITVSGPLLLSRLDALLCAVLPHGMLGSISNQLTCWAQSIWSSSMAFQFRSQLLAPFGFERFFVAFVLTGFVLVTIRRNFSQMRLFNDYDDELIKSVFYWASLIGCFVGFVLFRKTRPIRRRHHGGHVDAQQASTEVDALASEEWADGSEEEEEWEVEEHIDLDADLDRLLIESMFSGMPNLWLQPELISTEYIHQLPVWQFAQEEPPQTAVEESSNSSSTESSDTEESSSHTVVHGQLQLSTSTVLQPVASCSKVTESERCKSSKEAPECCSSKLAESCLDLPNEQITTQLRAKLAEKKRKIIRIRKKRSRRPNVETTEEKREARASERKQHQQTDLEGHRPKWMLDFNDCTICLDQYRHSQAICGLPCGHNYHNDCIVQWLVRGNHCCPICRWPSYRFKHQRQTLCCN